jgi:sugar phosphate isomerase/epimerase
MRESALEWYRRALTIASELGARQVGGHLGAMTSRDYGDARRRRYMVSRLAEQIKRLTERAKQLRLATLLWEPMPTPREPPSSVNEAKALLSRVNRTAQIPVKLCVDVGHACNPLMKSTDNSDPYYWLRELGAESPCVHLQQTDGIADRHWTFTSAFNKVGIIRPEKVVSALDESGAKEVYLFLESIPAFEQPDKEVLRDVGESVRYWKQYV